MDFESESGSIDPAGRAFDLAEIADGSFIDHDVYFAISPLGSELLVAETGLMTETRRMASICGPSIPSLGFYTGFVAARFSFGFVRKDPSIAVFPQAQ